MTHHFESFKSAHGGYIFKNLDQKKVSNRPKKVSNRPKKVSNRPKKFQIGPKNGYILLFFCFYFMFNYNLYEIYIKLIYLKLK